MRLRVAIAGLAAALPLAAAAPAAALPPVKHVVVVVVENKNYDESFGGSKAPYLAKTLTSQGALLRNYHAIGHLSLDNYIAMISGQAPNAATQGDCPFYTEFGPGTPAADGQVVGQGCVYPRSVQTVANQLEARGLGWRGYMEDMANSSGQDTRCRHPAVGSQDKTQSARKGDQYAARHNPFVYFHSLIDFPTCVARDVDLRELAGDMRSPATTPSYAMIVPNLCNDGHDEPCVDGRPGGLAQIDSWLRTNVPAILGSPGFKDDGALIVTFDEAENGDTSACCNEQPGPNTPYPGGGGLTPGPGGGRIGAVVISPFTKPGTVVDTPYNHYGLLRTVEDLFGLSHLGYAGQNGLQPFGRDVFNATPRLTLGIRPRRLRHGRRSTLRIAVSRPAQLHLGGACRRAVRRTHADGHRIWRIRTPRRKGSTCRLGASRLGYAGVTRRLRVR